MTENAEQSVDRPSSLFPAGLVLDVPITDFEQVSEVAPGWTVDYVPLGRGALRGRIVAVHTGLLQLGTVDFSKGYNVRGQVRNDSITVAFPHYAAASPTWRGQSLTENQAIVLRGFEEIEASFPSPQDDHLVVSVSRRLIDAAAIQLWGAPVTADRLTFHDRAAAARFRALCHRVLGEAQRYPDRLQSRETASILESDVVDTLLRASLPTTSSGLRNARGRALRRAYAYLMDHRDAPITVGDLCAASGTNERTLQRVFLETYGLPPAAVLKGVRLTAARRALRYPSATTSVTEVALHRGFFHLGRFAHDYRQLFGESPSETLRRAFGRRREGS